MATSHYKDFVASLKPAQRNSLRVLLSFEEGPKHLRAELKITKLIKREQHATGLARVGRTIELFPEHLHKKLATNLHPEAL